MSNANERLARLEAKAEQLRKDIVVTTEHIGYSHMGGGFSMVEMAVALYYDFLNWSPEKVDDPDRDRFILSEGHCGHVLYNILVDKGLYTKEELWSEYNQVGGRFGMHPNFHYLKGIEVSTGSLGHGLSLSVGYALLARMDKRDYWVVCMTSDGEMDEVSNWEALMTGAQYGLGNLVLIVDKNQFQIGGTTTEIKSREPLDKRLESFGWDVINIENGNDMAQVLAALDKLLKPDSQTRRRPIAIISNTLKGIGMIPGVAGTAGSHIFMVPNEDMERAMFQSIEALRKEQA